MHLGTAMWRGDERLAGALQGHSRELATSTLGMVAPAHRTFAAEILAMRFVERSAASVAASDWKHLFSWVDTACERYAGIVPVPAIVGAAAGVVAKSLNATPRVGLSAADLAVVCAQVERLAAQPRSVRDAARHEAIDEIDVALDDLMTRLDQADELTAEHSRAVSAWCSRLAQRLALPRQDAVHIARSGLIHDIGKITTPLAILNAPRSLDDAEMTIMRGHAAAGAAIVSQITLVSHLTPAVRSHHERFDGHGYPDGAAAGAIPSAARIVAVADAFNAMIGRRPYRPAFSPSVALERLTAVRGTQFDPIVVDAMIDVVTNQG